MSKNIQPYKDLNDETLMLRLNQGDRLALEHLYDRYFNQLTWFAKRFVFQTESAEDIVQEVFIKLIEKPGLFNTDRKFSTWIYTVTANECRNKIRNERNREEILTNKVRREPESYKIHHRMDYVLLQQQMQKALMGLNEKEQSIFVLRFEEEMSIKEIAEKINIPAGSVKSGIFHLLKKIVKHIKEFNYET